MPNQDIDRDLVIRWVKRLRDPLSRQAKNRLRSTEDHAAMCCLGHLCDLVDPDGWTLVEDGGWRFRCQEKLLPSSIGSVVGLTASGERSGDYYYDDPWRNRGSAKWALTEANDGGWTLPEIADALVSGYNLTPAELA